MDDIVIFFLGAIFSSLVLAMILYLDYFAHEEHHEEYQSDDLGKEKHEQFYELDRR